MNLDKGINEAGTFKLLCRNCDSQLFQDYEDLERLKEKPDGRMLSEIVLKNLMVMLKQKIYSSPDTEVLELRNL